MNNKIKMWFCLVLTMVFGCLFALIINNPSLRLSDCKSEVYKNTGVIIYGGYGFQLVRVNIDGVDYIANSKGGLMQVVK